MPLFRQGRTVQTGLKNREGRLGNAIPASLKLNSRKPIPPRNPYRPPSPVDTASEQQLQILSQAARLFQTVGVRSVTMDDVAQHMGMSKKTLYKYFSNKRDLVEKAMVHHVSAEVCSLEDITNSAENAIDEMLRITRHVNAQFASMNPAIVYETKKYYPKSWALFEGYKNHVIHDRILQNLKDGIAQGLYRGEINPVVLAKIYIARIDLFFDTQLFPPEQFRLTEVYREFMNYHIRGIASRKGVVYLEERINRQEQDGKND